MWNLPGPRIEPGSLALEGEFLTTVNSIPLDNTRDLEKLKGRLMQFQEGNEKSPANVPLKDI